MRKIIVYYAHPAPRGSEVNQRLADAAAVVDGVTTVDLYAEYPQLDIDVDVEQRRLLDHDVIVFLHPLYWYSTPAILKEWQDLVLEHGFAYGVDGTALSGKVFFNALSAGGPEDAYRDGGYNQFTLRQLLQPLEQTAALCGMLYLPPFALFSARSAADERRLERHAELWRRLLERLRDERLDLIGAQRAETLNAALAAAERG